LRAPAELPVTEEGAGATLAAPPLPWPRSLSAKLVAVVMLTTLVALTIALGAMVGLEMRRQQQQWIGDLRSQAELIARTTAAALAFNDRAVAAENLAPLRLRPSIEAAAVYDAQGRVFAAYAPAAQQGPWPAPPASELAEFDSAELAVYLPVIERGERLGTVYLRARHDMLESITLHASVALGVAVIALVVAFVLSYRLQRIVTRPILEISTVAHEVVTQRDYSRRVPRASDDEVGALVLNFNSMMAVLEQRTLQSRSALDEAAREVLERRRAQQEVMRLNAELEQRVSQRTSQLEASNRELAAATASAERANQAKSEFISSMSHELRTPLNAILGFGHLLSVDNPPVPAEKRSLYLEHIVKAGKHLLGLINEILDLARVESSSLSISPEPLALAPVLEECRGIIEPSAHRRSIQLDMPVADGVWVLADRTRLRQVLLNLLSNAIKYNRERGRVVLEVDGTRGGRVRLAVHDTGAGLLPEQLAALFQPFNRLGQESGPIEGTGIGLVVTKRLVELMGGSIEARSTPGQGASFTIELAAAQPLEPSPAPAPVHAPAAPALPADAAGPHARRLVLYVEDNPANLALVEEILAARDDLRLLTAPDAQIGLELARTHLPQVILMDLNLPGLSGYDALAQLRRGDATRQIPVIAVTASAMAGEQARALNAGFFRYVSKPIDVGLLLATVDAALALSLPRPPKPPGG
jgi:signal transduction histidine kinase/ActR/RegA family two-component response regulator